MATLALVVPSGVEDARNLTPGSTFTTTAATQHIGNFSGSIYFNGWRFTGVTIPQGSTISIAKLTMYVSNVNGGTTALARFKGVNLDNAPVFDATNTPEALAKTLSSLDVTFTTANWVTVGYQVISTEIPDVKDMVQEIVNRAGWVSGNALSITATDNGSTNPGYIGFATYDNLSTKASKLDITYTAPAATTSHNLMMMGIGA